MMTEKNIVIRDGKVLINGACVFSSEEEELGKILKDIYKHYCIDYPKFYKMSHLSKLGFIASELLLRDIELSAFNKQKTCFALANSSSSLHTDKIYQESIDVKPSPAIFVYTLPNILIGEICIRHGITGEGVFFIEESYNKDFVLDYARGRMKDNKAELYVAGWVDVDMKGNYLADLDLLLYIQ